MYIFLFEALNLSTLFKLKNTTKRNPILQKYPACNHRKKRHLMRKKLTRIVFKREKNSSLQISKNITPGIPAFHGNLLTSVPREILDIRCKDSSINRKRTELRVERPQPRNTNTREVRCSCCTRASRLAGNGPNPLLDQPRHWQSQRCFVQNQGHQCIIDAIVNPRLQR